MNSTTEIELEEKALDPLKVRKEKKTGREFHRASDVLRKLKAHNATKDKKYATSLADFMAAGQHKLGEEFEFELQEMALSKMSHPLGGHLELHDNAGARTILHTPKQGKVRVLFHGDPKEAGAHWAKLKSITGEK
jgi:hypothetical protein